MVSVGTGCLHFALEKGCQISQTEAMQEEDREQNRRETVEGLLHPIMGKRTTRWKSILQVDGNEGTVTKIGNEEPTRFLRIPNESKAQQLLFIEYLGVVGQSSWFSQWWTYLRDTYPKFQSAQRLASKFYFKQLRENDVSSGIGVKK